MLLSKSRVQGEQVRGPNVSGIGLPGNVQSEFFVILYYLLKHFDWLILEKKRDKQRRLFELCHRATTGMVWSVALSSGLRSGMWVAVP